MGKSKSKKAARSAKPPQTATASGSTNPPQTTAASGSTEPPQTAAASSSTEPPQTAAASGAADSSSSGKVTPKKKKKKGKERQVTFSKWGNQEPKASSPPEGAYNSDDSASSDKMEIDKEEAAERQKLLDSGVPEGSAELPKPPPDILKLLETYANKFQTYWSSRDTWSSKFEKKYLGKLALANQEAGRPHTVGALPFQSIEDAKRAALSAIDDLDEHASAQQYNHAFQNANAILGNLTRQLQAQGLDAVAPPTGCLEAITGKARPQEVGSDDESSEEDSESGDSDDSDDSGSTSTFDDDGDDTIEALAKAVGAKLPVIIQGKCDILGYSTRGNSSELLIRDGKPDAFRYRMMPAKGVSGWDPKNPNKPNLASRKQQRGLQLNDNGTLKYGAADVKRIAGVAWRDETIPGENPIQIMRPRDDNGKDKFPVTRVLIEWKDGEQTWEVRTLLRKLYPKKTADLMIYQRAGLQEERYRKAKGLPRLGFEKVRLPSEAPAFSSIAPSSRVPTTRASSKAASRAVSVDPRAAEQRMDSMQEMQEVMMKQMSMMSQSIMDLTNHMSRLAGSSSNAAAGGTSGKPAEFPGFGASHGPGFGPSTANFGSKGGSGFPSRNGQDSSGSEL